MANLFDTKCCGIKEVLGLYNDPQGVFADLCKADEMPSKDRNRHYEAYNIHKSLIYLGHAPSKTSARLRCGMVIFTDTVTTGHGNAFADWLRKNNLGSVVSSAPFLNPNSKNQVQLFMWVPNVEATLALAKSLKCLPIYPDNKVLVETRAPQPGYPFPPNWQQGQQVGNGGQPR